MDEKNKPDQYVEYLNRNILPHIDYNKLQESYDTDMVYAKGILNRMHEAMVSVYGGELLDETDGDEGIVVIPGIVHGKNNGKLCLALLDLDLSSSGEHWGTAFLCKSGVISQNEAFSNQAGASEMREAIKAYAPYDYCYTALIPDDIHVDNKRLPVELVAVLTDFRNHKAVLTNEREANLPVADDSGGYQMDGQNFESRMTALLPGIGSEDLKNLFTYAKEMEEDGNISASDYFKQIFVEFDLVTGQHGQETARQLLEVCKTFALNPWEIRDAADSVRDGVPHESISKMAVDVGFDRTGERWQEFEDAMAAFEKNAADNPQLDKASAAILPDPTGRGYVFVVTDDSDYYLPNVLHVQRDDSMYIFTDDTAAAAAAESHGVKLIHGMPNIPDGVYLDTLENRAAIADYFERERLSMPASDELVQKLNERLDENFSDYKSDTLRLSSSEVFDEAAEIAAVCRSYEFFRNEHTVTAGQAELLLKYADPLDFISDCWISSPVAEAHDIINILTEREQTHSGFYERVTDETVPAAAGRTITKAEEKPSVLDQIRQAAKETSERTAASKDTSDRKKSELER